MPRFEVTFARIRGMHRFRTLLIAVATALLPPLACAADQPKPGPEDVEFFEKRVRPILVEKCLSCHGEKKQQAGLRLDSRNGAIKGSENGPVLIPGKPDESPLILATRQTGDVKMPPNGKLDAAQIDALAEWVRRGAPWGESTMRGAAPHQPAAGEHWALQPVGKVVVPPVRHEAWAPTDLDRFIVAKLEQAGLAPAPPADRRTLVRRASFDLIGLPPTPEEVGAFENDPAPTADAFARVVDRLLSSPHYGERWGRYWLDVARYADNKGYVFFEEQTYPWAWTYRDWVIRALNDDLPYDQFVLRQLAADQLDLDRSELAALGMLTVGGHFMNNVHDIFDDRIDVVTRGLMGLTVTCARCHDHKFDPVAQTDYYALYGVFRSCSEPLVPPMLGRIPETEEFEYYELELANRAHRLTQFLERKHAELVSGARTRVAEYLLAAHSSRDQPSTEDFMLLIPEGDLHPSIVQRYWLYLARTRRQHDPVFAPWHEFAALPEEGFAEQAAALCMRLAGEQDPARPLNRLVVEALTTKPPESMNDLAQTYGELLGRIDRLWQEQQRTKPSTAFDDAAEEQLRLVFYAPDAPANLPMVTGWGVLTVLPDRTSQGEYQKLVKELEQWMMHGPHAPPRAMAISDDETPYDPRVFLRGNPNRTGEPVPRRFLAALDPSHAQFAQGSGRLELARAIAARSNPLTARVFVNRVWMHHFGAGLVRTPGDFGVRSEPPSHPELLDYLAASFMEDGWSIKNLHRRIMLSATYRQGSVRPAAVGTTSAPVPPESQTTTVDPENRLLSHFPRRRLDFEALRDSFLFVAGLLDTSVGGPPVGLLSGTGRRTVYCFVDRLALPGLFRTFDFPSPDSLSPQRDATTVPPQALFLMNSNFAVDCGHKLSSRPEVVAAKDFDARINRLYRLLYSRPPTADDLRFAGEFFGPDQDALNSNVLWQRYAHSLLMANEFVFVD
jgi:hypothetical protein